MSKTLRRTTLDIILFLSLFFLPWWLTLVFSIALLFLIDSFFEILAVGLILDTLYGTGNSSFLWGFPLTLALSVLFLLSFFIKEHITFNRP